MSNSEKHIRPPKFWAWLLSWLVRDDWETPVGDFEEYFNRLVTTDDERSARRWYRNQVLSLIPERLFEKLYWSVHMFKNYLKVSVRNLRRQPFYAGINVGGLAVGIAAAILIVLFIQDELSFDKMHANSDRIARVVETTIGDDGEEEHTVHTMGPLGPALERELPEVEASTRLITRWGMGRQTVQFGDNRFYEADYMVAEPSFLETFDFRMLRGNRRTALDEPQTVILTEAAVEKYFGDVDPIGKLLSLERMGDFTVTGVMADPPPTSHLQFSMLLSWSTIMQVSGWARWTENWESSTFITYLLLDDNASVAGVQSRLPDVLSRHVDAEHLSTRKPVLQPLESVHFQSGWVDFDRNYGRADKTTAYMVGLIALFILLIAAINYTNMATASSLKRAREVGLRKTVGAESSQLVRQFLSESVVTAAVALMLGLTIAWLALPVFNDIAGKSLTLNPVQNGWLFPALTLIVFFVGILAGSYPAFILSGFDPARVLKEASPAATGQSRVRRGLVVAQFALSMSLIVASLVVFQQLEFMQDKRLGFNEDQLVVVDINDGNARANFASMKDEFSTAGTVENVSVTSNVPGDWKNITQVSVRPSSSATDGFHTAYFLGVDSDFLDTFEISLLRGRNFSGKPDADSLSVILNQEAAARLGASVGDRVSIPGSSLRSSWSDTTYEVTVIGIAQDFHVRSLREEIDPVIMGFRSNPVDVIDYYAIRITGTDVPSTLSHLRTVGETFDSEHPFEFNFLDERIAEFYRSEVRLGRIFGMSTALAILIACLGLFGLAAYTTARRTKEIGIRKVLGASVSEIVLMLSRDIVLLVGAAFLVATPLSWWLMNRWLDRFAYRIEIGPGILLTAGVLALLFGVVTVSYQSIKAAVADPVKSLRYE